MSAAILPRSAWTATPNGRSGRGLLASEVTAITVHYPASGNISHAGETKAKTAARLEEWRKLHTRPPRSWADIGYNYAIDQAGRVWDLTGLNRGAHAGTTAGNRTSVGVLLIVGDNETPSSALTAAFRALRTWIITRLPKATKVRPHSSWTSTSCPGVKVRQLIESGDLTRDPDPSSVRWFESRFLNVWGDDSGAGTTSFTRRLDQMIHDLTTGSPEVVAVCELRDAQAKIMTPLMTEAGYIAAHTHAGNGLYLAAGTPIVYRGTYWLPDKVQGAGRREALLRCRAKVAGHFVHLGVSHLDYRDATPKVDYDTLRVNQAKSIIAAMTRFGARFDLPAKHRHLIAMDDNSNTWVRDRAMSPAGYKAAVKHGLDAQYTGAARPVLSSRKITTDSDHPIVAAVIGKNAA